MQIDFFSDPLSESTHIYEAVHWFCLGWILLEILIQFTPILSDRQIQIQIQIQMQIQIQIQTQI